MLLCEFFYYNKENEIENDMRYDANRDNSVTRFNDTRKTKLTLKHINYLRKQSEAQLKEKQSELQFIKQMYGTQNVPQE